MKHRKNEAGLTIIEVIVSIAILTLILAGSFLLLDANFHLILREGESSDLLFQSQDVMNSLLDNEAVDMSAYPDLELYYDNAYQMQSDEGQIDITGTYYIIRETATGNDLLEAFHPEVVDSSTLNSYGGTYENMGD
jgi:Tfp pilus assembly protein PilV